MLRLIAVWFQVFLLTLIIEVPVFVLFVRKIVPLRRALLAGAAGTAFTHPLLWIVWYLRIFEGHYWWYFWSGELFAAVVESLTFYAIARPVSFRRAVFASFTANAVSAALGMFLLRHIPLL